MVPWSGAAVCPLNTEIFGLYSTEAVFRRGLARIWRLMPPDRQRLQTEFPEYRGGKPVRIVRVRRFTQRRLERTQFNSLALRGYLRRMAQRAQHVIGDLGAEIDPHFAQREHGIDQQERSDILPRLEPLGNRFALREQCAMRGDVNALVLMLSSGSTVGYLDPNEMLFSQPAEAKQERLWVLSLRNAASLPERSPMLGAIGPFPPTVLQSELERRWLHYALLSRDGRFGMVANVAWLGPAREHAGSSFGTSILLVHERDAGWRASQYNALTRIPLWSAFRQPHPAGDPRPLLASAVGGDAKPLI